MRSVLRVANKCLSRNFYLEANRWLSIRSNLMSNCIVKESKSSKTDLFAQKSTCPTLRLNSTYITIKHINHRFFIEIDGRQAYLTYDIINGVMNIKSTKVPKAMGGHGLGKLLAKEALEFAIKNKLLLKISCEFVEHYIKEYEPSYTKYISH